MDFETARHIKEYNNVLLVRMSELMKRLDDDASKGAVGQCMALVIDINTAVTNQILTDNLKESINNTDPIKL